MQDYLNRLVLQKFDSLNMADSAEICKNFDKNEVVLFSMQAVKINQRNWKQTRTVVITSKGMYNFNGKNMRRFVDSSKIRGCIYSSKSYELIVHIPTEFDYHYVVSEQMEKLIYYLYVCKQLNSPSPVELVLVKTVAVPRNLGHRILGCLRREGKAEDRRGVQTTRGRQPPEGDLQKQDQVRDVH